MQNKMIKLSLRLPVGFTDNDVKAAAASALRCKEREIGKTVFLKQSLDARKKSDVHWSLSVAVEILGKLPKGASFFEPPKASVEELLEGARFSRAVRVAVVGSGPAGLFCALTLASAGASVTLFERGADVKTRTETVERLKGEGVLDPSCNVQFGEGGAGTFSDGKLNTGTKSPNISAVLGEFVRHGAPEEILFLAKPHIGTDYLKDVVVNLRKTLQEKGVSVRFQTKVEDFLVEGGRVTGVVTAEGSEKFDDVVLACGHSARDTYEALVRRGAMMEQKPFSIGVRIEHRQKKISIAQYGEKFFDKLPAADYKLACHLPNGRSCYTFCMCPGGEVVPGCSEEKTVVTNGMSLHARDKENANAAVLVGVSPSDFGSENVLAGVSFQRKFESLAFVAGGGGYRAPVQLFGDFLKGRVSTAFGEVAPTYRPGTAFSDLASCLPPFVTESLKMGVVRFGEKLKGYDAPDALMTGVETRSSAPVRILRDESGQASLRGLYPCGEGAGYAGGIMSAATDGIGIALKLLNNENRRLS